MPDIDFSEFRTLNNYTERQPLYPFVEVTIGDTVVTDFDDSLGDTLMDLSYRRTAHQDVTDVSGDSFTLTLYDDTAIEIESLIYNVILKTTHQAEEQIGNPNPTQDGNNPTGDSDTGDGSTEGGNENDNVTGTIFGTPNEDGSDDGTEENPDNPDGSGDGEGTEKSDDELWAEALEQINNIDINYGWVDMNGNKYLDRNISGNYQSYSMEFEGASAILTIEGTSVASGELNSPSSSSIEDYPSEEYGGVPSKIVKTIVKATPGLKYTNKSIEETEPMLGEDGKPKSFKRSGETPEEFIKKYLCEEAVSKKTGKVGYSFYTDEGIAYYLPNETPEDVNVGMGTETNKKGNATLKDVSSIRSTEYDDGFSDVDIVGGAEFTDDIDDYDEIDEFDDKVNDDELDEDDLPDTIDEFTGILDAIDNGELSEEEIIEVSNDLSDFESEFYDEVEHEEDDSEWIVEDEIVDEIKETEDSEIVVGKEKPPWLRKFGIKLEL